MTWMYVASVRVCSHHLHAFYLEQPPTVPLLPLDDAKLDLVHDSNDLHRTSTIATMRGMVSCTAICLRPWP